MFLLSEWVKVGQSVWLFATSWAVQSLEFFGPEYWSVGSLSLLQGMFPAQGWNPVLPHCGMILYQLSYKGSPRVLGSLSLLRRIFPTQESNWGLLHCRRILYRLSYQGSPIRKMGPPIPLITYLSAVVNQWWMFPGETNIPVAFAHSQRFAQVPLCRLPVTSAPNHVPSKCLAIQPHHWLQLINWYIIAYLAISPPTQNGWLGSLLQVLSTVGISLGPHHSRIQWLLFHLDCPI